MRMRNVSAITKLVPSSTCQLNAQEHTPFLQLTDDSALFAETKEQFNVKNYVKRKSYPLINGKQFVTHIRTE
jgi:hypothetical protein